MLTLTLYGSPVHIPAEGLIILTLVMAMVITLMIAVALPDKEGGK